MGIIVRRVATVDVGVETRDELFCADTPDCELERSHILVFVITLFYSSLMHFYIVSIVHCVNRWWGFRKDVESSERR